MDEQLRLRCRASPEEYSESGVYSGSGQAGWRIETAEYEAFANPVRTLTAAARDQALNPTNQTGR